MGRKKLNRSEVLYIRTTPKNYIYVRRCADKAKVTVAEWINVLLTNLANQLPPPPPPQE